MTRLPDNFSYQDLVPILRAGVDTAEPFNFSLAGIAELYTRFPTRLALVISSDLWQELVGNDHAMSVFDPECRHHVVVATGKFGTLYGIPVLSDAFIPPDTDTFRLPTGTLLVVYSTPDGLVAASRKHRRVTYQDARDLFTEINRDPGTLRALIDQGIAPELGVPTKDVPRPFEAAAFLSTPAERAAYLNEFIGDDALFTSALIDCINSAPDLCISADEPEQVMTAVDLTSVQQFLQKLGLTLQIVPTLIHSEVRE